MFQFQNIADDLEKIHLKDFNLEENEHFIKSVFIPYFKDIYNDLCAKSDRKDKGINKVVFTEVTYAFQFYIVCKLARNFR